MNIAAIFHPARTLKLYRKVAYFRRIARANPTVPFYVDRQKTYEAKLCWFGRLVVGMLERFDDRKADGPTIVS